LYAQAGNKPGENRSLRQAEAQFIKRLKDNPLARDDRLQLALAQVRLEKYALAEETILKGVELHNDTAMRRSAAEFYVMLFDVAGKNRKENLVAQFEFLEKALRQDLFFGEIYERLIRFYQKAEASKASDKDIAQEDVDHGDRILELLEKMLVDGRSPALVHFALSSIYQIRGNQDKSTFHLLASYRLDSNFPVVTNNYAWMLAHSQTPDLPRAYELAMTAVRASPNDPRFLDTYATILMKLDKHHDAIAVFEKIVSQSNDKVSIHVKLAELYAKVGMKDFAKKHQEKAEELTQQEADKAMKAQKR
jgi:tetratricopeptide (TPR) repeat protein